MNVLIYVVDALRADHLSCYGYDRETSPNINDLALDGIRYTNCFSPSTWTRAVGCSLLSGTYPSTHGVTTHDDEFTSNIKTIPQLVGGLGFDTVCINANGNLAGQLGFARRFDTYIDLYKRENLFTKRGTKEVRSDSNIGTENKVALPKAADVNEALIQWIKDRNKPFFALCWAIDPHAPYDPPERFDEYTDPSYDGPADGSIDCMSSITDTADYDHLRNLYDGEVRYTDSCFGTLTDSLRDQGLYDETLILLAGDHGEAFGEHGSVTHGNPPYEEMIHVPLVIKPPKGMSINLETVSSLVSLVDICPTICELSSAPSPKQTDGRPMKPFSEGAERDRVFAEVREHDYKPGYFALRTADWKYMTVDPPIEALSAVEKLRRAVENGEFGQIVRHPIQNAKSHFLGDGGDNEFLFDLTESGGEDENLIDSYPDRVSRMREELREWRGSCLAKNENISDASESGMDEQTAEQLRQLGYME